MVGKNVSNFITANVLRIAAVWEFMHVSPNNN